jgi:RNase adaptor protein for sRNA GlmZ degradation
LEASDAVLVRRFSETRRPHRWIWKTVINPEERALLADSPSRRSYLDTPSRFTTWCKHALSLFQELKAGIADIAREFGFKQSRSTRTWCSMSGSCQIRISWRT